MIKCPHCGKRVQGPDLIAGICSSCNQKLTIDGDSVSGDSKQIFVERVRESLPSNRGSDDSGPAGDSSEQSATIDSAFDLNMGSEATFVSDEFVDSMDDVESSLGLAASDDPSASGLESSDDALKTAQTIDSHLEEEPAAEIGATYISEEMPEEILKTEGDLSENSDFGDLNTFEQNEDGSTSPGADDVSLHMKTFVVETSGSVPGVNEADKTFVSDDVPEGLLKTVESLWGSLEEAEPSRVDSQLGGIPTPPPVDRKKAGAANQQQQTLVIKTKSFSDTSAGTSSVPRFQGDEPEYELTKVLGEGGMGIVYDARQTSIDRNVAVKMLKAKSAGNQKQRAKFLAEAVVTGELDHPNIVPIYDVGSNAEGALFYSMKKVQGTPWLKAIKQKTTQENIEILMKIADAVGFAHARGVVHRDLKPENVMLGEYGEVLVMDWGLAQPSKTFRKSRSITETNTMGGTPAYMAPEMTTGPIDKIGPRSDVYLLGAMLFEILTGGPPHVAKNAMKCLMAAARNEIAPTDKKGELMDIAMKAMATNPDDRFQDVKSFQAAIRDYQSHSESILLANHAQEHLRNANSRQDYELFSKAVFGFQQAIELWSENNFAITGLANAKLGYAEAAFQKGDLDLSLSLLDKSNPGHATLIGELQAAQAERDAKIKRLALLKRIASGLAAAVFVIVTGAAIWIRSEQMKAEAEAERANEQAKIATDARNQAQESEKVAVVARIEAEQSARAESAAKVAAIEAREDAIEQKKIAVDERNKAEEAKENEEKEAYVSKIGLAASQIEKNAFTTARQVLETCKPELRNWEWGRLSYLCSQEQKSTDAIAPVDSVAIDLSGKRFATGGWEGTARIWNLATNRLEQTLAHDCDYVHSVSFSPDGKYLATGSNSAKGFVQLWDAATGENVRSFKGHTDAVLSVMFSRDGRQLLTGSYDKTARLWNVETGEQIREFRGHTLWVWSATFSRDEKRIVTTGQDGTAIVYDVEGRGQTPPFTGHRGPVYSAAFSPDGKSVVSAGYDRRLLVWKPEEIKPYDFQQLKTIGKNSASIRETRVIPPAAYRALDGHTDAVRSVRFSEDGALLVSGGQDNTVRVWEFSTLTSITTFRGHGSEVTSVTFLPNGTTVLSASHDKTVREWNVASYEELRILRGRMLDGHEDAVLSASYSGDQKHILTASRDRSARTWDVLTGRPELELKEGHEYLASSAIFFPDGRKLVTAAIDNTTRIWDSTTGGQVARFDRTGRAAAVALAQNKRWIATGGEDKSAQIWDIETTQRIHVLADHKFEVTALAFSPDDRMLATGDFKGHVRLWNVESGELIGKIEGHTGKITSIVFLDEGRQVATSSLDRTVGQWKIPSGKELTSIILKHPDSVVTMKLIPGTGNLVTSCADRIVRIWDPSKATVIETIGPFAGDIDSISISSDEKSLIVGNSKSHTVHLWDLTSQREVELPQANGQLGPLIDLKRRGGILWSVAFQPGTDDILTVGGSDVRLWDRNTGKERMSFAQHGTVAAARYSPDGKQIATGSWDNSAKIWDVDTKKVIRKLEGPQGHTSHVNSAVFSADGARLLTASDDGTAKLWNLGTGEVLFTLKRNVEPVRSAKFSPDGKWIATASNDKTACLWQADDGQFVREFTGHGWGVVCLDFTPDSRTLITGSDDNSVRLWNIETGQELLKLEGHTASITSVSASPDGNRVLSGSQDQSAKLWDVRMGKEILTLSRHTDDVTSVAFSPDGQQVLTASRDGTAVIWLSKPWNQEADAAPLTTRTADRTSR